MSDLPAYLTVKQTASHLQISDSAVYALVQSGKLASHRVGNGRGTIRISRDDLSQFIDGCRVEFELQELAPAHRRPKLRHIRL